MYRNDLRDIASELLIDQLTENSKKYTISLAFYAALADRRPKLEDPSTMNQFKFKDKTNRSLDDVRNAAKKGRENR